MRFSSFAVCLTALILIFSSGCSGPEEETSISRERRERVEVDDSNLKANDVTPDFSNVDP